MTTQAGTRKSTASAADLAFLELDDPVGQFEEFGPVRDQYDAHSVFQLG